MLITGNGNGTSFVMADFQSDFENQLGKAKIDIVETGAEQTAPLTFIDSKSQPIAAPANFTIKFTSEATEVPQPSTWLLVAIAVVGLLGLNWRRKIL